MGPVITVDPTCLGLVLSNTNFVKAFKSCLNSGLKSSNCVSRKISAGFAEQDHFFNNMIYEYQVTNLNLVKSLEIIFVAQRPHKGEAFSVWKKSSN